MNEINKKDDDKSITRSKVLAVDLENFPKAYVAKILSERRPPITDEKTINDLTQKLLGEESNDVHGEVIKEMMEIAEAGDHLEIWNWFRNPLASSDGFQIIRNGEVIWSRAWRVS